MLLTLDRFAPEARALRQAYDARFADPRSTARGRFVWDYWHVPGQYTHLRTPAWELFPEATYRAFHERLVWWGRRTLGCHDVSPPWLSCYVDGCGQRLHADVPHGPFAFVFSLTRWPTARFEGGQTLLLDERVLDWWSESRSGANVEEPELVRAVDPRFNRLVVFDPRVPHGVREVRGTRDVREGRLVVHGWFVQPRPFVEGPLPVRALARELETLPEALASVGEVQARGLMSVGFAVRPSGQVAQVRVLADTVRAPKADAKGVRALREALVKAVRGFRFPRAKGPSRVTLPVTFDA